MDYPYYQVVGVIPDTGSVSVKVQVVPDAAPDPTTDVLAAVENALSQVAGVTTVNNTLYAVTSTPVA
jgi:hypothetical protein